MDKLLEKAPMQLADERAELFALLDRFQNSIEEFHRQYRSIRERAEQDSDRQRADKNSTLQQLRNTQQRDETARRVRHAATLEAISQRREQAERAAGNQIAGLEKELQEKIRREKDDLSAATAADERHMNQCLEVLQYLKEGKDYVSKLMYQNLMENLYDPVEREVSAAKEIPIGNLTEAMGWLSNQRMQESRDAAMELEKIIRWNLFQFPYKEEKKEKIRIVLRNRKNAQTACDWLKEFYKNVQAQRSVDAEARCCRYREECSREKQQVIRDRDRKLQELERELGKENSACNADLTKLAGDLQKNSREQETHRDAQIAASAARWKQELEKCGGEFIAHMKTQYPADRMNAWLGRFWQHPVKVEDYSRLPEAVYGNVLIGIAVVDITGWSAGAEGSYVRKILRDYGRLFGRNVEEAEEYFRENKILLPYSISVEEGTSLVVRHDDACDERAKKLLNAISMRMLRSVPAGWMRFLLFDAAGMGAFGSLKALDPANIVNPSEPTVKSLVIAEGRKHSDMAGQLTDTEIALSEIDGQLHTCRSIREFNERNPLSRQIYRPLCMTNYPYGLEEEELRTLNKLITDGAKLGFSFLAAEPDRMLANVKPEMRPVLEEIAGRAIHLRMDNGSRGLRVINSRFATENLATVRPFGLPSAEKEREILADIRRKSVEAARVKIRFSKARELMPEVRNRYREPGEGGIIVPIGYLEGGQPFKLLFDDAHINTIILGKTGSGKTNLLHILMMNLMLRYDPAEVMLYLIDFKYGADFRIYTQYNLPMFQSISIHSDPEVALDMIRSLVKEQQDRALKMGTGYHKISEYNADHPQDKIHRILLIIDELYVLAESAEADTRTEILRTINELVRQGRAFGIHLVLCGQDLDKLEYFDTISRQCTTRIAMNCEEEQVRLLMGETGAARMHSIEATDQGTCVVSIEGGARPQLEHTAFLTTGEQEQLLSQIHQHYLESDVITDVSIRLTQMGDDPNHPLQMFQTAGILPEDPGELMIGDPITSEDSISLRPAGNLWVAGGNVSEDSTKAAQSLLFFAAYSLLLEKMSSGKVQLFCTNCADRPGRSSADMEKDRISQLANCCPEHFTYGSSQGCIGTLNAILDEMDRRKSEPGRCENAVWWFLLRPELVSGLTDNSNFIIDLKELLLNGPGYNIHVLLWNYDLKMARKLQLDPWRSLFSDSVCLEMGTEDRKIVSGIEQEKNLKGYKAVVLGERAVRIRIYDNPEGTWMNQLFARIAGAGRGGRND